MPRIHFLHCVLARENFEHRADANFYAIVRHFISTMITPTITDTTELEIFGFHGDHSRAGTLCCRWRVGYVREIHLQGHAVGHGANSVKFDWLEKATRPSMSTRVKAALTIDRGNLGFNSSIGGRETDPWVPANRDLESLFVRLHPSKSEGQFFLRWSEGDGDGRLQFVEWFKTLLAKYPQHQVVIFDPYFEDVGLGLVLLCASPEADCQQSLKAQMWCGCLC